MTINKVRLELVPESPGVYLMKDAEGSIIYVGKAINLRRRLHSYFTPNPKGSFKVLSMIDKIFDFDFIVCQSELEALLLESSLIKKHQPFYNILLKDNRDYPYICIDYQNLYPRVFKSYRIGEDVKKGAKYYGPYLQGDLKRALDAIHNLFPLKTCKRDLSKPSEMRKRPCFNFYINRCAPCDGSISSAEYRQTIDQVALFLEGHYKELFAKIDAEIQLCSDNLQFEKAAKLYQRKLNLQDLINKQQTVVLNSDENFDVFAIFGEGKYCVQKLEVRQGKITGSATYFSSQSQQDKNEVLAAIILSHYNQNQRWPQKILLPNEIEDFEFWLNQLAKQPIKCEYPQRGKKQDLLKMAYQTASKAHERHFSLEVETVIATKMAVDLLTKLLGLRIAPERMEAYDISNNGNDDIVGAMVVWEDGQFKNSDYRNFNLNDQIEVDDYLAMRTVLGRRLKYLLPAHGLENTSQDHAKTLKNQNAFSKQPDLLLIDGGKGHVQVAIEVLASLNLTNIAVAGMIKDNKHRTRGLVKANGEIIEIKHLLRNGELTKHDQLAYTNLLKFLTQVQDEVHRLAVKINHNHSKKRQLYYSLENIKGIGKTRRKQLLESFKSLDKIAKADKATLIALAKLPEGVAETVYRHFHEPQDEGK